MNAEREMTLDEFVDTLGPRHRARRELTALRAELYRLAGCHWPNSKDIAVVMVNGERHATSTAIAARVQELEYELRKLPVISAAVKSLHKQRDEMARIAGKALRELIDICGRSGGGAALAGTEKPVALAEKGDSDAD